MIARLKLQTTASNSVATKGGGDQLFMPDDGDQNLTSTAYNNNDKYHLHILVGNTFLMGCLLITTRGAIHSDHREKVRAGGISSIHGIVQLVCPPYAAQSGIFTAQARSNSRAKITRTPRAASPRIYDLLVNFQFITPTLASGRTNASR